LPHSLLKQPSHRKELTFCSTFLCLVILQAHPKHWLFFQNIATIGERSEMARPDFRHFTGWRDYLALMLAEACWPSQGALYVVRFFSGLAIFKPRSITCLFPGPTHVLWTTPPWRTRPMAAFYIILFLSVTFAHCSVDAASTLSFGGSSGHPPPRPLSCLHWRSLRPVVLKRTHCSEAQGRQSP